MHRWRNGPAPGYTGGRNCADSPKNWYSNHTNKMAQNINGFALHTNKY